MKIAIHGPLQMLPRPCQPKFKPFPLSDKAGFLFLLGTVQGYQVEKLLISFSFCLYVLYPLFFTPLHSPALILSTSQYLLIMM
jgi:hypothetical protein